MHTSSLRLIAVGVMVAAFAIAGSMFLQRESATASTPDLNGLWEAQVPFDLNADTTDDGFFICRVAITHDTGTQDVQADVLCETDIPALAGDSPLDSGADGIKGPPPPPPYTTAEPTKLFGTLDKGTDTLTLIGCFDNVGGALGPNVIVDASVDVSAITPSTGETASGTVDIYPAQTIADCDAGPPATPSGGAITESLDLTKLDDATDADSDTCSDLEELQQDKTPAKGCGDDPLNPHDSDESVDGPFSLVVTNVRADVGAPGTYFYCIGENKQSGKDVTGHVFCYQDSPAISGAGGSAVPSSAVGLPGAPPPFSPASVLAGTNPEAGFLPGPPVTITGTVTDEDANTVNDTLTTLACFDNIGPPLGPYIISEATINIQTGVGTVDLWVGQDATACTAAEGGTAPGTTPTLAGNELLTAEQDVTWDSDGDGCSDADEVQQVGKCGNDPFNPLDSDSDPDNTWNILAIQAAATGPDPDADPTNNTIPPAGAYFHCTTDIQVAGDNTVDAPIYCYIDIPGAAVNSEIGTTSGDGYAGPLPPGPFGDIPTASEKGHTVLTGSLDKPNNEINISGCFVDGDGAGSLGHVYVEATINIHTGLGSADVFALQPDQATCESGTPAGSAVPVDIEAVEQPGGSGNDNDHDGCPDSDELGQSQSAGGLRDPYNTWDYFNPTGDGQNRVDDILAVVGQFGVDDPDPAYTESTDRTTLAGASDWNLGPPNGQQRVDDILAIVKQFGHDCS